eukprot:m.234502 g.234502  ORF g.234502 m.234502 type:complete len:419 (-) comp17087_c4_seq10:75-1331(-)
MHDCLYDCLCIHVSMFQVLDQRFMSVGVRLCKHGFEYIVSFGRSGIRGRHVHGMYRQAEGDDAVSYPEFCYVWRKYLKHIDACPRRTDVCDTCLQLRSIEDVDTLNVHLTWAREERFFHHEQIDMAKLDPTRLAMSLDFAESIRLPLLCAQPKSLFFQSGLKMDILGIATLASCHQRNYVIPETDRPVKKGCDLVISLLHYDLQETQRRLEESTSVSPTFLYIMADNCGAHAKNNSLIRYLAIRSALYQQDIYLHFLLAGHTKGYHDGCFGLIKRALKKRDVYCPDQLMQIINDSARCNVAVDSTSLFKGAYTEKLTPLFTSRLKNIKLFHHFFFDKSKPGLVQVRRTANDGWEEQQVLTAGVDLGTYSPSWLTENVEPLPQHILSDARRAQLGEIRDKYLIGNAECFRDNFFPESEL